LSYAAKGLLAMQVLNIHERELSAAAAEVGALLNTLSSDSDTLWPKAMWPPMRFDRPLGIGASGGHGPVRYTVEAFSPGRWVKFRFTGPKGFNGSHCFEVVPKGDHIIILRHTIDMNTNGPALLSWPLVFRPLHDALLEDSLALAQASLGDVPQVRPWSPWVKFLRWALSGGKTRSQQRPEPSFRRMLRNKAAKRS
jgi:hypothetical protein